MQNVERQTETTQVCPHKKGYNFKLPRPFSQQNRVKRAEDVRWQRLSSLLRQSRVILSSAKRIFISACSSHRRHSFYFIYGRRAEVRPQFRICLQPDNNYTLAARRLKKAAILKRNLLIILVLFSSRVILFVFHFFFFILKRRE